jgi:fibronectin-binding autotransporter adhesin
VVLQGLNGRLGQPVYGNGELLTSTNVLGTTAAAALNNGILPASILVTNPTTGVATFATYGSNGFAAFTGSLASSFAGGGTSTLAAGTAAQTLTGVNDLYAASTTANVSGGTLRFLSLNNTNMGGLLLNGYGVAAPVVSSDLVFGNTRLPGQPSFGEALVYVGAGSTSGITTLSGAVSARNLTKFGNGALLLSGNLANLTGNLAVNSGSVQFGGANAGPLAAQLSLNDLGTLDLAGSSIGVANLAGTQGVITGGGTLSLLGTQSTTYSGVIGDGATATRLVKKSGNTLTLSAQTPGSVMSGNNTFTGGVDLYNGTLLVQNPYALGGFNNTTPGTVNLYGGALDLRTNAGGLNGTSIFGNPSTLGLNIVVRNAATINVDRIGANAGNAIQIGSLSLGNTTLTQTAANTYRLRVAGTTSIQGSASIFNPTSGAPNALELMGNVTDGGAGFALNKRRRDT